VEPVSRVKALRAGDAAAPVEAYLVGEALAARAPGGLSRAFDRIQVSASGASRRLLASMPANTARGR
jgi:hypothetical protein